LLERVSDGDVDGVDFKSTLGGDEVDDGGRCREKERRERDRDIA
jgi:hypothetical protein